MTDRILCVDDDLNVLEAYQRALRRRFRIETALSGAEGLVAVATHGPYAVVVSDMRMPKMDGVQFLSRVREFAPQTIRMMLTGNSDQQTALDAVNEGQIFRFMTKPCPPEIFAKALEAGLEQYRLVMSEKELLSKTLSGSIKLMTDVLSLVNPTAFGRGARVHRLVGRIAREMKYDRVWLVEIAAMLSQIGCVAVPQETLEKVFQQRELSTAEAKAFAMHPQVARDLLSRIPRLEGVAQLVAHQNDRDIDPTPSGEERLPDEVRCGCRILKAALDWDSLSAGGLSDELAMAEMNDRHGWYDPVVLAALRRVVQVTKVCVIRHVRVQDLPDGVMLAEDVRSIHGTLLCARGQEVTPSMRVRLRNYVSNVGIQAPVKIFVPAEEASHYALEPPTPGTTPRFLASPSSGGDVGVTDPDVVEPNTAPILGDECDYNSLDWGGASSGEHVGE